MRIGVAMSRRSVLGRLGVLLVLPLSGWQEPASLLHVDFEAEFGSRLAGFMEQSYSTLLDLQRERRWSFDELQRAKVAFCTWTIERVNVWRWLAEWR